MAVKHCPGFRRATWATCGSSSKSKQRILRASVGSIPSGPRRNKRLFWRQEISPSPGMPRPPNFSLPEFFHSFRGRWGDFRDTRSGQNCIQRSWESTGWQCRLRGNKGPEESAGRTEQAPPARRIFGQGVLFLVRKRPSARWLRLLPAFL